MKKPNTKRHWTALAIARYYDKHGTACRARDLYPMVDELHEDPARLVSTLAGLERDDVIGALMVLSPNSDGGTSKTNAYYPTTITIESLLDIGEPTEMPDGAPVTDDLDTTIPRSRVSGEDEKNGDIPLPDADDAPGLDYPTRTPTRGGKASNTSPRDYKAREPVAEIKTDGSSDDDESTDDTTDESTDDSDEFPCSYCGDTLSTPQARGAHEHHCLNNIHEQALEEWADVRSGEQAPCPYCGEMMHPKGLGNHRAHCLNNIHEQAREEYADETAPVGHDRAYLDERTVERSQEWEWWEMSQRLNEKAEKAREAGLTRISSTYTNFAALAMQRDLNESTGVETAAETILTKEMVLMLLGVHHSNVDPDIIESDALAQMERTDG